MQLHAVYMFVFDYQVIPPVVFGHALIQDISDRGAENARDRKFAK